MTEIAFFVFFHGCQLVLVLFVLESPAVDHLPHIDGEVKATQPHSHEPVLSSLFNEQGLQTDISMKNISFAQILQNADALAEYILYFSFQEALSTH